MKPAFPEIIDMQLTYLCNLSCKMCGQWGRNGIFRNKIDILKKSEIETGIWISVLDEASEHNSEVHLWGGEPLLSKHFRPIARRCSEAGVGLSFITNGTLLKKFAGFIADSNIRTVCISIDGDCEIHDQIRGEKGIFSKIIAGIKALINSRGSSERPYIEIAVVMMKDNEEKLKTIVKMGMELGVDRILFQPLMFITPELDRAQEKIMRETFRTEWKCSSGWNCSDSFASAEKVDPFLKKLPRKYGKMETDTSLPVNISLAAWQNRPTETGGRKACLVPWEKINIMPDGDCNFCLDFPDYTIGNVKKDSVEKIWNGSRAEDFRSYMEKEGSLPVCRRCIWFYNDFTGQNKIEGKRS